MQVSVKADIAPLVRGFVRTQSQIAFALALALTRTAQEVKAAEVDHMRAALDRPKPFTLNSLWVDRATKTNLVARVEDRFFAKSGTPASKYLRPLIEGGPRGPKRFEKALTAVGITGFAVPARNMPLDAYGNVSGATISAMLSGVRASRDATQNVTPASAGRRKRSGRALWFVVRKNGTPVAIGRRRGGSTEIVFRLVRQPSYAPRLTIEIVARATTDRVLAGHFQAALAQALGTQR